MHYISTFCVKQPHKKDQPFRLVVAANKKIGPQDGKDSLNPKETVGGEESRRSLFNTSPCSVGQNYDYITLLYLSFYIFRMTL